MEGKKIPLFVTLFQNSIWKTKTLVIRKKLGHEHRRINIFKIDCEGCEYGVFTDMGKSIDTIDNILTEFHYAKTLGLQNDADIQNKWTENGTSVKNKKNTHTKKNKACFSALPYNKSNTADTFLKFRLDNSRHARIFRALEKHYGLVNRYQRS